MISPAHSPGWGPRGALSTDAWPAKRFDLSGSASGFGAEALQEENADALQPPLPPASPRAAAKAPRRPRRVHPNPICAKWAQLFSRNREPVEALLG
ncbi:hypothetical protein H920_10555 [Fukomys damarensis]|uniref:Uncharacterized protein n=1 Tax=Fukomys damarensis TaxID=885580 RepID=A0A091DBY8_FUKDA|nr:hypothetical protein H920_10555 [Fukomys damarensis]